MELLQWLDSIDMELFTSINQRWALPSMDWFMKALRNANTWIPLYIFILFFTVTKVRPYAIPFILLTLLCFALADHISAAILKPWFGRIRPCHLEALQGEIRSLVGCGGRYSMPSTHASNHFALAGFWFLSINYMRGNKWSWLFLWAIAIGYAQVYVGKHYPFDILIGAILGLVIALFVFFLFKRWVQRSAGPGKVLANGKR